VTVVNNSICSSPRTTAHGDSFEQVCRCVYYSNPQRAKMGKATEKSRLLKLDGPITCSLALLHQLLFLKDHNCDQLSFKND
jgi:hypothetical protein